MAKNIILLSDGTGNSSNALNKSNVWRLMQALDVSLSDKKHREQLAFYDNGVGTSGPIFVQKIVGAFGFGLSRNVRDLYEQLCRHYEPGDKIYIFGFSRGAFTARVLAHFIGLCGILDRTRDAINTSICDQPSDRKMSSDRGLKSGVKDAYRSYRQWYWDNADPTASIAKCVRSFWYKFWRIKVATPDGFRQQKAIKLKSTKPVIYFVGVWDTVDALGMPIKELSDVIDRALYPYKFPDHVLGPDVTFARQALAIDEARHSFTPLPWDECLFGSDNKFEGKVRLRQVWFAGMHSDIGGGYPEDTLALISLDWMIAEVKTLDPDKDGLRFLPHAVEEIKKRAQPTGKMHDSRRGFATFYRYKPRSMPELCGHKDPLLVAHYAAKKQRKEDFGEGKSVKYPYIPTPIVHYSVIDRLQQSIVGYAPTGFTNKFNVFRPNGDVSEFGTSSAFPEEKEIAKQKEARIKAQDRAAAHIWWRRTAYFIMLITLFFLFLIPLFWPYDPALTEISQGWLSWLVDTGTTPLTSILPGILAGPVSTWTKAWAQSPVLFLGTAIVLYLEYRWSTWIQGNIQRVSEFGWYHLRSSEELQKLRSSKNWKEPRINWFEMRAQKIRKHKFWHTLMNFLKNWVLRILFVVIVVLLAYFLSSRLYYHLKVTLWESGACEYLTDGNPTQSFSHDNWVVIDISKPCTVTDIRLDEGLQYRVHLRPAKEFGAGETNEPSICTETPQKSERSGVNFDWLDASLEASPKGLSWIDRYFDWKFWAGAPYKRHVFSNWMSLIGEVGQDSGKYAGLGSNKLRFTAPGTGKLHLYVNDAVAIWPITWLRAAPRDQFYQNNSGKICVMIQKL